MARSEHCAFFSLGLPQDGEDIARAKCKSWISDLSPVTSPFENLAQAISQMDVVVTVCTSVAHLAGGMGKPVFVLLNTSPDWRWGRDGETTPWYPSMRLFRQTRFGDWSGPVAKVVRELAKL